MRRGHSSVTDPGYGPDRVVRTSRRGHAIPRFARPIVGSVSAGVPVLEVLQPEDGGVAEHVLRLATGLHGRGWAVEVATPAASAIVPPLREAGVPVHDLEMVRRPGLRDLGAARALRAIDRRGGYRLVHGHSSKAGALVRAVLPRRRRLIY
ncbi:MAG: glycosyltransferase family 4 protein, partial [Actinobacteria bacterium]